VVSAVTFQNSGWTDLYVPRRTPQGAENRATSGRIDERLSQNAGGLRKTIQVEEPLNVRESGKISEEVIHYVDGGKGKRVNKMYPQSKSLRKVKKHKANTEKRDNFQREQGVTGRS